MNAPAQTSGTAVASLIFGILTWVFLPFIGALVAVICGHVARSEIRRSAPGTVDGDGLAIAGMILGYVQLGICVLAILVIVGLLMLGLGLASSY
jgi:hypothetical protein